MSAAKGVEKDARAGAGLAPQHTGRSANWVFSTFPSSAQASGEATTQSVAVGWPGVQFARGGDPGCARARAGRLWGGAPAELRP